MAQSLEITVDHSPVLELFLATYREVMGRFAWEISHLELPLTPEIARFRDGVRIWRECGVNHLSARLLDATTPADIPQLLGGGRVREGSELIAHAMTAAQPRLQEALESLAELRRDGETTLGGMDLGTIAGPLAAALGVTAVELAVPVYPLLLAPLPSVGFLADGPELAAAFVDCRRLVGTTLIESVAALLAWGLLWKQPAGNAITARVATLLPGKAPYQRRLRAVLVKLVVELTSGHVLRAIHPDHQPCFDVMGTAWRYPRLADAARRHWGAYLVGAVDRDASLDALTAEISKRQPWWFVDHVNAASLAADFYLMDWLAANGDNGAVRRLEQWLPRVAGSLASQLDLIIGAELGHYERTNRQGLSAELAEFLRAVTKGDSQMVWPRVRAALGDDRALRLAGAAFAGPGKEFGGQAWAPVTAVLRRYVNHELPYRVFVDQCFTLEHNNGSLFDRFFDIDEVPVVLTAQAAGDLETLARYASAEVRARWDAHRRRLAGELEPAWLAEAPQTEPTSGPAREQFAWVGLALGEAPPGALGCGSALPATEVEARLSADSAVPVRLRRPTR